MLITHQRYKIAFEGFQSRNRKEPEKQKYNVDTIYIYIHCSCICTCVLFVFVLAGKLALCCHLYLSTFTQLPSWLSLDLESPHIFVNHQHSSTESLVGWRPSLLGWKALVTIFCQQSPGAAGALTARQPKRLLSPRLPPLVYEGAQLAAIGTTCCEREHY